MKDKVENYWVWFDPLLEEYFWIEDGELARGFLEKLKTEAVVPQKVQAIAPSAALEAAFPNRKEYSGVGSRLLQ